MAKRYVRELLVAEMTGLSLPTLRADRVNPVKRIFPYVKIGRSVRYDLDDVIRVTEKLKLRNVLSAEKPNE